MLQRGAYKGSDERLWPFLQSTTVDTVNSVSVCSFPTISERNYSDVSVDKPRMKSYLEKPDHQTEKEGGQRVTPLLMCLFPQKPTPTPRVPPLIRPLFPLPLV